MDDLSDVSEIRGGWWMVLAVCIAGMGNLLVAFFAFSSGVMALVSNLPPGEQSRRLLTGLGIAAAALVNLPAMAAGRHAGRSALVLRVCSTVIAGGAGLYCAYGALGGLYGGGLGDVLGWGLGAVLAGATLAVVYRPVATEEGDPRCARCGYDLTGTGSAACPECGAGRRWRTRGRSRRRRRVWRRAAWTALAACAVLCLAAGVSELWSVAYCEGHLFASLSRGSAMVVASWPIGPDGRAIRGGWRAEPTRSGGGRDWVPLVQASRRGGVDMVVMPLWTLVALGMLLSVVAWRRGRVRAGWCAECGCDVRRLPRGACPECGAGIGGTG